MGGVGGGVNVHTDALFKNSKPRARQLKPETLNHFAVLVAALLALRSELADLPPQLGGFLTFPFQEILEFLWLLGSAST